MYQESRFSKSLHTLDTIIRLIWIPALIDGIVVPGISYGLTGEAKSLHEYVGLPASDTVDQIEKYMVVVTGLYWYLMGK